MIFLKKFKTNEEYDEYIDIFRSTYKFTKALTSIIKPTPESKVILKVKHKVPQSFNNSFNNNSFSTILNNE